MDPAASAGATLRRLFNDPEILVAPGAYDAITARVLAAQGFPAIYMTGAGTVNAHLGLPDIALGTLDEFVQNAGRIVEVVDVPVFCDADTGFGNAVNVVRTVRSFERVGVAGIHLEDQESPKRCGHLEGKRTVTVAEMVGKIRAATRRPPPRRLRDHRPGRRRCRGGTQRRHRPGRCLRRGGRRRDLRRSLDRRGGVPSFRRRRNRRSRCWPT